MQKVVDLSYSKEV